MRAALRVTATAIGVALRNVKCIAFTSLTYLTVALAALATAYMIFIEPKLAIAAVIGMLFLALALARPFHAFIVWLVLGPLGQAYGFPIIAGAPKLTFDRAALPILLVSIMLRKLISTRRRMRIESVDVLMILVMAVTTASLLLARISDTVVMHGSPAARFVEMLSVAQGSIDHYIYALMAFYVARNCVQDRRHMGIVLAALGCIALYLAPIGILEHITGKTLFTGTGELYMDEGNRAAGPFVNAAVYGLVLCYSFVSLIWMTDGLSSKVHRLAYYMCILLTCVAMAMTFTRSVWASTLLASTVIAVLDRTKRKAIGACIALIVLVGIVCLPMISRTQIYSQRIANVSPITSREYITAVQIRMVKAKPLLGHGLGNLDFYKQQYPVYLVGFGSTRHPPTSHNTFLTMLVEVGILGILPYVALLGIFAYRWVRILRMHPAATDPDRRLAAAIGASVVGYLVTANIIDMRFFRYAEYILWVLLAMLSVLYIQSISVCQDSLPESGATDIPTGADVNTLQNA